MFGRMLTIPVVVLLLVFTETSAWSQKKPKSGEESSMAWKSSTPRAVPSAPSAGFEEAHESKARPRFAGHSGEKYILEEEDDGGEGEEFVDEEGHEEHAGQDQERGYRNEDKKVDDEVQKDFQQTGAYQDFSQGGALFDKHHKDRVAENKENEDVKEHDAGEKFGSEALKEHKLGRHRDKSKGHKKHGFKNVYHKEEYGDHKTFHDEFLDNDHFHDYDDQHEHRQMQGGRFSKGFKREGENKEHDVGDEKHAWGKAGHDGKADGYYEKGGHLSGHHHGHKKNEGHHDAKAAYAKHASHKLKKGEVPAVSSHYHQGDDQPQYYSQVHHSQDNHAHYPHSHSQEVLPEHHYGGHHARHHRGQYDQADAPQVSIDKGLPQGRVLQFHEHRSPHDARRLEVTGHEKHPGNGHDVLQQQPLKETQPVRESFSPVVAPEAHPFHYTHPETKVRVLSNPNGDRISEYRQQHGLSENSRPPHHLFSEIQSSKHDSPVHHSLHNLHSAARPHSQLPRSHPLERQPFRHQSRNNNHRHFLIHPNRQQEPRAHHHHQQPNEHGQSQPYPWWEHSATSSKKVHPPRDSHRASSHNHFGYERAPEPSSGWKHHWNGDHQPSSSHHHPSFTMPHGKHAWHSPRKYHSHL